MNNSTSMMEQREVQHFVNNAKVASIRNEEVRKVVDKILSLTKSEQEDFQSWCIFNHGKGNIKVSDMMQYFERPTIKY